MIIDATERALQGLPLIRRLYARNAATLKRGTCLLLDQLGQLRPLSFVQWLVTYRCNFRCAMCEASAGKPAEGELDTGEALVLVDDLAQMGVRRLVVSGGEPLVRPDILEVMGHAQRQGIELGLVTNSARVEALWPSLRRLSWFLFFTSVDGLPAHHDAARGEGSFARVMDGLERFASLGVPTRTANTPVHAGNIGQLSALHQVLRDSGANRWHLMPVVEVGRAAGEAKHRLDGAQLRRLLGFIRAHDNRRLRVALGESCGYLGSLDGHPSGKPFFCGAGLTRCAIMPDGEVLGCQTVYDNDFSEGNVRDTPFSEIWRDRFQRFRDQRTLPGACVECAHLRACQGGCWSGWARRDGCLKKTWEQGR